MLWIFPMMCMSVKLSSETLASGLCLHLSSGLSVCDSSRALLLRIALSGLDSIYSCSWALNTVYISRTFQFTGWQSSRCLLAPYLASGSTPDLCVLLMKLVLELFIQIFFSSYNGTIFPHLKKPLNNRIYKISNNFPPFIWHNVILSLKVCSKTENLYE